MILNRDFSDQYLEDFKNGKIKKGLGIGLPNIDIYLRYKPGEFTIINGLDNVGKTVWMMWYFLVLATKYDLKFAIWSGENKAEGLVRQLIQFKEGKYLSDMTIEEVYKAKDRILNNFKFIDPKGFYKNQDLYKLFEDTGADACLIDPYTGMNREFTHKANYDFLNETRHFVNNSGMACYVNTHPNTEAARRIYPLEHEFNGYPMPPSKAQSEGGQPFANRPDNFFTLHRLVGHPEQQFKTLFYQRKVKDTETGGTPNGLESPCVFDWNGGLGFTEDGFNPLSDTIVKHKELEINTTFETETDAPF